jgi:tRNA dimethylallyltransferase
MVYRGLDIGTGKPSTAELASVPHHLIDILDPSEAYSAGRFVADTRRLLPEIRARGRMPVVVGGTMLYLRALSRGIAELPAANAAVRARIDARAATAGWPALHAQLARLDPRAAQRIGIHDAQRIQRALEVHELTGEPLTAIQQRDAQRHTPLALKVFGWCPRDRAELYRRIETRFAVMLSDGLLDEALRLFRRPDLSAELPAMRSVGYRQLWPYFAGKVTREAAVDAAVRATRHLARRQLIWMRAERDMEIMDSLDRAAGAHMMARVGALIAENGQGARPG